GPFGREPHPLLDQFAEGAALDVLHHNVRNAVAVELVLARVVYGDDVAVVQRCRRLRLPAEPSLEGRVRGVVDAEHLDRHYPAQTVVTAPAYLGHAATTEDLTQLVAVSEESWLAHQLPLLRICSKRTVPVSAAGALTASLLPIPEHGQHGDQHDNHAYPSNSHQAQPTPRRVS